MQKNRRNPIRINIISESTLTVSGHGVHSVFEDNLKALQKFGEIDVISRVMAKTDVLHLHTVGPLALALMYRADSRTVVTAHITPESLAGSVIGGRKLARHIHAYLRWFYNKADLVIALSEHQRAELKAMGVHSEISVIPNAAPEAPPRDMDRTAARLVLGLPMDQKVVLSVGQVQPRKGVSDFYEVAECMPETQFIWVGGFPFGPLTSEYWKMLRRIKRRPANVRHTGQLSRDEVKEYYAASDVYFHPSHHEVAPMAVIEAASYALPLVLRDLECYRTTFEDSYSPADDSTFAQRINKLLIDREYREKQSDRAHRLAERQSLHHGAAALVEAYARVVGVEASPPTPVPTLRQTEKL